MILAAFSGRIVKLIQAYAAVSLWPRAGNAKVSSQPRGPGARHDVLDIGIFAIERPTSGVPHRRRPHFTGADAVQQLILVVEEELEVRFARDELSRRPDP